MEGIESTNTGHLPAKVRTRLSAFPPFRIQVDAAPVESGGCENSKIIAVIQIETQTNRVVREILSGKSTEYLLPFDRGSELSMAENIRPLPSMKENIPEPTRSTLAEFDVYNAETRASSLSLLEAAWPPRGRY